MIQHDREDITMAINGKAVGCVAIDQSSGLKVIVIDSISKIETPCPRQRTQTLSHKKPWYITGRW